MEYTFRLELDFENNIDISLVTNILEIEGWGEVNNWNYEIVIHEDDEWIDFISVFHEKLSRHKEILRQLFGNYDATIWFYYEYKNQCNIELSKTDILKLKEMDCSICFSCWEE